MLRKIAEVLGFPFNEEDQTTMALLQRVQSKMPASIKEDHPAINAVIRAADEDVQRESARVFDFMFKQAEEAVKPKERVFKIKPSLKGARIKVAAANGVRFSFGPVWNESVKKGKGIALVPTNRTKLNHQAELAGIANADKMEVRALCAAIAETL